MVRLVLDALQARDAAELDATLGPLVILGKNIVGNKSNLRSAADKLVLSGRRVRFDKREYRGPVGRSHRDPALTGLKMGIIDQTESELLDVEFQASILISNENLDRVKAEIGIFAIRARRWLFQPFR